MDYEGDLVSTGLELHPELKIAIRESRRRNREKEREEKRTSSSEVGVRERITRGRATLIEGGRWSVVGGDLRRAGSRGVAVMACLMDSYKDVQPGNANRAGQAMEGG